MRPCVKKVASGDNGDRKSGQVLRQNADLTLPGLQREIASARRLLDGHISNVRINARIFHERGQVAPRDLCRGLPFGGKSGCLAAMHTPPSPCDGTCRIDPVTQWCLGCKRTLAEIADWPMLRPQEKRAILNQLGQRQT